MLPTTSENVQASLAIVMTVYEEHRQPSMEAHSSLLVIETVLTWSQEKSHNSSLSTIRCVWRRE